MSITIQSTYGTDYAKGFPGMLADGNTQSRPTRTIEDAAGIAFGKAAFQGSNDRGIVALQTLVGAGSAAAGNVGTSTITTTPTVGYGALIGRYRIVQLDTSATGALVVYDPTGIMVAHGVVGTAITTIPGITTITVTSGGTATKGDTFYIDVTGNKFIGVTIADAGVVPAIGGTADVYAQYANVSLLDMGDIWVTAGSDTTINAPVYLTSAGVFTATATSAFPLPATFLDTVSSGAVVKIRLVQTKG
jgi:hypothetical protein